MPGRDAYIKVEHKDGTISTEMSGKGKELLLLICVAINQIYISGDESSRKGFRLALASLLMDPESPVWDPTENGEGIRIVTPCVKEDEE